MRVVCTCGPNQWGKLDPVTGQKTFPLSVSWDPSNMKYVPPGFIQPEEQFHVHFLDITEIPWQGMQRSETGSQVSCYCKCAS